MDGTSTATQMVLQERVVTKCLRTKKLRQEIEVGSNCPIRPPPAPRPSRSAALSLNMLSGASIVSFREESTSELSKLYDEEKEETYFEQCFTVLEKIGSGSFADVYKVVSLEDDRIYAIKCTREAFKSETERQERFEEVERYETLGSHRNLIRFVKSWQERNRLYIQFEYCAFSASHLAKINHKIDECYVWQFLIELLFALKHIHDRNLVHLDVKLDNILIKMFDDDCRCENSNRCLTIETSSFSCECESPSPNAGPTTSSLNTSAYSMNEARNGAAYDSKSALEAHFATRLTPRSRTRTRTRSHSGNTEHQLQTQTQMHSRTSTTERCRFGLPSSLAHSYCHGHTHNGFGNASVSATRSRAQSGNSGTADLSDARTPPKSGDSRMLPSDYAAFSAIDSCCGCVLQSTPTSTAQTALERSRVRAELVRRRGCAKLGDCGISIDLAKPNRVLSKDPLDGDAHYLAAEVLEREQFAKPADVFALALCVVELAFDIDLPSNDEAWHFLRNEPFPLNERLRAAVETTTSDTVRQVGEDLQRILERMLIRDPVRRASVDEVLTDASVQSRVSQYLAERGLSCEDVFIPVSRSPSAFSGNISHSKANALTSSSFFDSDSAEMSLSHRNSSHKLALVNGLRAISPIPRNAHAPSSLRRQDKTPLGNYRRTSTFSLSAHHFNELVADQHDRPSRRTRVSLRTLLLCVCAFVKLRQSVGARSHADVHKQLATLCLYPAVREPTPNKRPKLISTAPTLTCTLDDSPVFAPPRKSKSPIIKATSARLCGSMARTQANTDSLATTRSMRSSADAACTKIAHSSAIGKRKRENDDSTVSTASSYSQRRAALNTSSGAPSSLRRNAMRNAQLMHAASSDQRSTEADVLSCSFIAPEPPQVGPHGDAMMDGQSIVTKSKNSSESVVERTSTNNLSRRLTSARLSRVLFTGSPTGLKSLSAMRPNFVPKRLTFEDPDDCEDFQPDGSSSLSASSLALACRRNLSLEFEQE